MGAELGLVVLGVGSWREEQLVDSEYATTYDTGSENWFHNSLGFVSTAGSSLNTAHFLFYHRAFEALFRVLKGAPRQDDEDETELYFEHRGQHQSDEEPTQTELGFPLPPASPIASMAALMPHTAVSVAVIPASIAIRSLSVKDGARWMARLTR